jgi:hypothetical protein
MNKDVRSLEDGNPCIIKHCGGETYCEKCGKRWDYGDYDGTCWVTSARALAERVISDIDAALGTEVVQAETRKTYHDLLRTVN